MTIILLFISCHLFLIFYFKHLRYCRCLIFKKGYFFASGKVKKKGGLLFQEDRLFSARISRVQWPTARMPLAANVRITTSAIDMIM